MLLPNEDPTTIRDKKKLLDRVTLVVCCNTRRIEKVPIAILERLKNLPSIVRNTWPYLAQRNDWIDIPSFKKLFDQVFILFILELIAKCF